MAEHLQLKKSNCKNCYKCIRNCPVKSIRFSAGQANIVGEACILCGQCFVSCPQNAKEIADSIEQVRTLLAEGEVVASVAPSFIALYPKSGIVALRRALREYGFADVQETAQGASLVKDEYKRILKTQKPPMLISSACHSANLLIQKYYPTLLPYLADVLSPMQAHAQSIKAQNPAAKVVFIGPCVAKKEEADSYKGYVDAVLTFEELGRMLEAKGIVVAKEKDENKNSRARFFPIAGGIIQSMQQRPTGYEYITVDGVENCMQALENIQNGDLENCFIEMSACTGSCIGGPVLQTEHRLPLSDYVRVSHYAGELDFELPTPDDALLRKELPPLVQTALQPSPRDIEDTLRKLGKTAKIDELDCGSCGYNSCREKAVAVLQGRADLNMCLPFLMDKAESMSDHVINDSPLAILVLNEYFEVQKINTAALELMKIRAASDVLGEAVVRILDPTPFMDVQETRQSIVNQRCYLAEYGRYVEQTIRFNGQFRVFVCLMRDISEEEAEKEKKEALRKKTMETTDKVIEKQMRVVQEIASLLGETTAETKVALTKLKESLRDDETMQ